MLFRFNVLPACAAFPVSRRQPRDEGAAMSIRVSRMVTGAFPAALCLILAGQPAQSAGQGSTSSDIPQTREAIVDQLECSGFEWQALQGIEKAAMRVPVRLNGVAYSFQLDTGAEHSYINGDEAAKRGWTPAEAKQATIAGIELGGTRLPPAPIRIMSSRAAGGGTVGLDLLLNHLVVIDYPRQRFCLVPRTDIRSALAERVRWSRASLHHGKLFIPIKIGERWTENVFFDTGASIFPLSVDGPAWQMLTGLKNTSEAETTLKVGSWGREIPLAGARSRLPVEISGIVVGRPMVYTNAAAPGFFREQIGGNAEGLVGSAPFLDQVVVLDLTSSIRFGLLR